MKRLLATLCVLSCSGFLGTALAATDTDTLNVSATVLSIARITTVGDIAFGNYDPTDPLPTDSDGAVTVRATKGLGYTIYIGNDRTMTDGTDPLNYELYSDGLRTSAWGDTLLTGEGYSSTTNAATTYDIYGRIAALQDIQAGAYGDTVTITLEW